MNVVGVARFMQVNKEKQMNIRRFRSGIWSALAGAVLLGFFLSGVAHGQSTWQQIKQKGELRIGVTPGEPWYF